VQDPVNLPVRFAKDFPAECSLFRKYLIRDGLGIMGDFEELCMRCDNEQLPCDAGDFVREIGDAVEISLSVFGSLMSDVDEAYSKIRNDDVTKDIRSIKVSQFRASQSWLQSFIRHRHPVTTSSRDSKNRIWSQDDCVAAIQCFFDHFSAMHQELANNDVVRVFSIRDGQMRSLLEQHFRPDCKTTPLLRHLIPHGRFDEFLDQMKLAIINPVAEFLHGSG